MKVKRIKGYIGKKNWGGRFLGRRGCGCKHVLHMLLLRHQQRQEVKTEGGSRQQSSLGGRDTDPEHHRGVSSSAVLSCDKRKTLKGQGWMQVQLS